MTPGRKILVGLVLLAAGFGAVVLHRSVGLRTPQGDLRVYCRAAWAVRAEPEMLYRVTDDHGWHYHYPPPFAILMTPFADAPPGRESVSSVPYPIAVVVFYLVNLACLAFAAHELARMGERWSAPGDANRWWRWRLLPAAVCLPAVGLTLVRSQVQLMLLALLVGFASALVRERRWRAGLCLAGAICLKVFPAYLLLLPLARRDGRCLAGCAIGLAFGLVLLPIAALGPRAAGVVTLDRFEFLASVFTADRAERPGGAEMLESAGNQSQSVQMVLHKTLTLLGVESSAVPAPWVRALHWLMAAGLTLAVLLPGSTADEAGEALAWRVALLTLLMVLICPICHLHYLTLAMPLCALLLASEGWSPRLMALGVVVILATSLPMVPGLRWMRDIGVPLGAMLCLLHRGWVCAYRPTIRPAAQMGHGKWRMSPAAACSAA